MRIGFSKDIHKLVPNRKLMLGGVHIPFDKGLLGHSDADVVLHAVAESIIGALGLGDLGTHFPDTDPFYQDIDSSLIVEKVVKMMEDSHLKIGNIDISIHLERPRLAPYKELIRARVAFLLHCDKQHVNIKAGTNEGLDAVGRQEAIEAVAVVLLIQQGE